jgi:LmbE family N-acetylglucosaminyl deacetylase
MENKKRTILVFGAHPDDAEIGMGGSIKRLSSDGHDVYLCIAAIPDHPDERTDESLAAAKILGIKEVLFLPMGIHELGYNRKTIGLVDNIIATLEPYAVFTHWIEDSHQDHINLSKCVVAATRKNNFHVLMYENTIPGGLTTGAFRAQYFIDISSTISYKLHSIESHASQIRRNGDWWIQGINGRAMYRGYQIHANYAEAFEVIKINNDVRLFASTVSPVSYATITKEASEATKKEVREVKEEVKRGNVPLPKVAS